MSLRIMLIGLIVVASATPVLAFNDSAGNTTPDNAPAGAAAPPNAATCHRARPQLTAEEKARRQARRAERRAQLAALGITPTPKPRSTDGRARSGRGNGPPCQPLDQGR